MKKLFIALVTGVLGMAGLTAYAQNGAQPVQLKEITDGKFYAQGAGYGMMSMPDGEHYTQISNDHTAILKYSYATGKAVDTLFSVKTAHDCDFKYVRGYEISPNGHHILIYSEMQPIYRRSRLLKAHHYDVRRNQVEPLSNKPDMVMIPTFSPDGRMVAFVRDNNLFIRKFDFNTEVQITEDGKQNHILNGVTDWVYEEEFAVTSLLVWSSNSEFLSYVRSDESHVKQYDMPMYGKEMYPSNYSYKYPKAGEDNSTVSLWVYNVGDRSKKQVGLGLPKDAYIPRIAATTRNNEFAIFTLNRRQNDFRLFSVDAKTLIPKMIFKDKEEQYVENDNLNAVQFNEKGFLYLSEKDGYRHIYQYGHNGNMLRQITQGAWDVTDLYGMDDKGTVYYQSAEESPLQRAVYTINTQGKKTKLSTQKGTNNAVFSTNFRYYLNAYNNINTPTVTSLYATQGNKQLRILEDNAKLNGELASYRFNRKEFITLKNDRGQDMNAWILKPAGFDPNKKYPVLMLQYSGPNSQEVLDRYEFGWEYHLAAKGVIVVSVDGRGTGARGEEWRKCTYMQLGILESQDQIAAARALGKLPYVDAGRIGIWGWSFGGYNTLMSLCHGNGTFKLGIAVAAVTDWHFYDSIYTERFMRTPQENPDGYKKASVLPVAGNLKGKLLLVHGSADDNVHLQNMMAVSEQFVQNNIPFDMAIYTDKNHGIYGGNTRYHLFNRFVEFIAENL
ncbi:S9 family peptidase [Porphyromonas macacae]|uniref:S9 family peptidase n=1 Tax=Porphyromonas macacae TaxID=28115 RepID=UPI0035A011C5